MQLVVAMGVVMINLRFCALIIQQYFLPEALVDQLYRIPIVYPDLLALNFKVLMQLHRFTTVHMQSVDRFLIRFSLLLYSMEFQVVALGRIFEMIVAHVHRVKSQMEFPSLMRWLVAIVPTI